MNELDVLKARFEDHIKQCEKQERDVKLDLQDVWSEMNKLRPMVWKVWAIATTLPIVIGIIEFFVISGAMK